MNVKVIDNLIKYITNNYNKINNYTKEIISFTNEDKINLINHLKFKDLNNESSYIGKEYIKLKKHIIIKFNCKLNIILNIYVYNKLNNKILNNIIQRIYNMIELFYKGENNKQLIIYMILYNCPRLIPLTYKNSPNEMNEIIYENNLYNCVNGWFRNLNKNEMEILITRLKTSEGLLIHELCHLCNLDFGGYNSFNEWNNYKIKYNINDESEFTEGINNAISSIIHAIFSSIEDNNKNVKLYLDCELYYSKDLIGNLLHYFKCKNINELKKVYCQKSMMFEYIILRFIYLNYINEFYHLDKNFNDININKNNYFKNFINKLKSIENSNIELNENMIIKKNNEKTNFLRMEYYLL